LLSVRAAYSVLVVVVPVSAALLGARVVRARRRGASRPALARALVLCFSTMVGLVSSEAAATAWHTWITSLPTLPTRFSEKPRDEIHLVVIGESSAEGVPYHPWLSVGKIVAWQLERALPGRHVQLQEETGEGIALEQAILLLRDLKHQPDAIVIYAGHNEFQARFGWERFTRYYPEEKSPRNRGWIVEALWRTSPLCRLIDETIDKYRIEIAPPPHVTRELVDHPVYSPKEYAFLRTEFHRRLEGVVAYSEQIGALPILIIPPGNDAGFAPFRSVLAPRTPKSERDQFATRFWDARSLETNDPTRAIAAYQALLDGQPTFAEAHFRLARLSEQGGDWQTANRHYVLARDLDAFPMRCPSDFQDAYRAAAARHDVVLVDGPAVFLRLSPHEVVDDHLLHDAQHPNLRGYLALAQDLLERLQARHAFGWKEMTPAAAIDPDECAAHFGLDAAKWAAVCERTSLFYGRTAFMRYDPSEQLVKAHTLQQASLKILNGVSPEALGIAGLGVHPTGLRDHPTAR